MSLTVTDIIEIFDDKPMAISKVEEISGLKVYKPEDLMKYNSFEECFNSLGPRLIVIWLSGPSFGHFTCLIRQNDKQCYFFDSYGLSQKELYANSPTSMQAIGNVDIYGKLKAGSKFNFEWNNHVHQLKTRDDYEQTCGWHCISRCKMWCLDNNEYNTFICSLRGISPDYAVVLMNIGSLLK